ncbi:uncharacterized GPI-anchored protein At4g28100-like [Primulina huaijiensis]|uniref:uncharacterized GPI-anchored protein At4g28100-like n=1 Tax=Primulina huaijiensis TaxID=1492673 RepID=UPI003CC6E942
MSPHIIITTIFFSTFLFATSSLPVLPNPDPATQTLIPVSSSPPATIPAFPEQSDAAGCPLDLPEALFNDIKSACGSISRSGQFHRTRCCPVLAAWLYSAYSRTALSSLAKAKPLQQQSPAYEMPVLPDDSENCVDSLEKALGNRGIELGRPNETCDVVYCYCGIRLHPFSCPEAFSVDSRGELVGGENVKRLERDCVNNGFPGLGGCSKCLSSLYSLNGDKAKGTDKTERTSKMHSRDCELMGLTWLLHKDRYAYIHTVSAVLRALMMNAEDDMDPTFCSLNSDDMPLAVDSSEIGDSQSSSNMLEVRLIHYLLLFHLLNAMIFSSSIRYWLVV